MNLSTWVVVADAHAALVFSFVKKADPWKLVTRLDEAGVGGDQTADFAHKASQHKGALHDHGGSTSKDVKERHLARAIAHALERGLVEDAFGSLALVAPPKLLGELRENLSRGLQEKVVTELHKDHMHLSMEEIASTLRPSLPL
jgi:protein required for attachment to host cells